MSRQNVEVVRRWHQEFNEDGWDALWRVADPEIEFREPPEQPGATVFKGLDAARAGVTQSWQQNWIEQRSVAEQFVDLGDDRVLVLTVEHLRGRDGIEVEQPAGAIVTLRDSKVVRFEPYWNQQTAFQAARVAE